MLNVAIPTSELVRFTHRYNAEIYALPCKCTQ